MNDEIPKRPGKNATETAKEKWKKYLKTETIEQRTKRIGEPRIHQAGKKLDMLISMARSSVYKFNEEQAQNVLDYFKNKLELLEQGFQKTTKKEEKEVL